MAFVWHGQEPIGREMPVNLNRDRSGRARIRTAALAPDPLRAAEKILGSFTVMPQ